MASDDLLRSLMGALSFFEGTQEGAAKNRDFASRLAKQRMEQEAMDLKRGESQTEDLTKLGAPRSSILRGFELQGAPTVADGGMSTNGIRVGQNLRPDDTRDLGAYDRFQSRLSDKAGGNRSASDPILGQAVRELGQLREKSALGALSPREQDRLMKLEEYSGRRIGLSPYQNPREATAVAPTKSPSLLDRAKQVMGLGEQEESAIFEDPGTKEKRRIPKSKWTLAEKAGKRRVK